MGRGADKQQFNALYGPGWSRARIHHPGAAHDSPFYFEHFKGWTNGDPGLIALYSGTENWILSYGRLPDALKENREQLQIPSPELLRFQEEAEPMHLVRSISPDGRVHLEQEGYDQIWVSPNHTAEAINALYEVWDEPRDHELDDSDPRWFYCPDQELLHWVAGQARHHRLAVRVASRPFAY